MYCICCWWFKVHQEMHLLVRKVKTKPSDWNGNWVTVGIWSISSRYRSWPKLQPSPHRMSFKARLSSQPWPWLQSACTSWGRRHAGSPIRGINPRTNEQAWQSWKWKESRRITGIESFLSLSIICGSSVVSNHRIHLQTAVSQPLIWMGVITCRLMETTWVNMINVYLLWPVSMA